MNRYDFWDQAVEVEHHDVSFVPTTAIKEANKILNSNDFSNGGYKLNASNVETKITKPSEFSKAVMGLNKDMLEYIIDFLNRKGTMPRVYISGPISMVSKEEALSNFAEREKILKAAGFNVFNPITKESDFELTYEENMRIDINELLKCDLISFLPNFWRSHGCRTELFVADSCGIRELIL
jgi:hypothetical protein